MAHSKIVGNFPIVRHFEHGHIGLLAVSSSQSAFLDPHEYAALMVAAVIASLVSSAIACTQGKIIGMLTSGSCPIKIRRSATIAPASITSGGA